MKQDIANSLSAVCDNLFFNKYKLTDVLDDGIRTILITGEMYCDDPEGAPIDLAAYGDDPVKEENPDLHVLTTMATTCVGPWISQSLFHDSRELSYSNIKTYVEPVKGYAGDGVLNNEISTVSLFANPSSSRHFRDYPYQDHLVEMALSKLSYASTLICIIRVTVVESDRTVGFAY